MLENFVSCIIPVFNDNKRLPLVIKKLQQIPLIGEIIVVDDGSVKPIVINKSYKKVRLLRHQTNTGKASAIQTGVSVAKFSSILLFDADIQIVSNREISAAITTFLQRKKLDLLILRTAHERLYNRIMRTGIVISGERLIRKVALQKVLRSPVKGYQLEVAINQFMIMQKKQCSWSYINVYSPHKLEKLAFWSTITTEYKMFTEILSYHGLFNYLYQLVTFCRQQI